MDIYFTGMLTGLALIVAIGAQTLFLLRQIVRRQTLPGYELIITQDPNGAERLNFAPTAIDPLTERLRKRGLVPHPGEKL